MNANSNRSRSKADVHNCPASAHAYRIALADENVPMAAQKDQVLVPRFPLSRLLVPSLEESRLYRG